jgi:hypothetical protein
MMMHNDKQLSAKEREEAKKRDDLPGGRHCCRLTSFLKGALK